MKSKKAIKAKTSSKVKLTATVNQIGKRFCALKRQAEDIAQEMSEWKSEALILTDKHGDNVTAKTKVLATSSYKFSLTERDGAVQVDEDKAREVLSPALWEKATTRVLDNTKLTALVESGELNPKVLASFTSMRPSSTSITISEAAAQKPEDHA